jgi:hypothetical protein
MVVKKMAGTPVPPVSVFTGASTLRVMRYVMLCYFRH